MLIDGELELPKPSNVDDGKRGPAILLRVDFERVQWAISTFKKSETVLECEQTSYR